MGFNLDIRIFIIIKQHNLDIINSFICLIFDNYYFNKNLYLSKSYHYHIIINNYYYFYSSNC